MTMQDINALPRTDFVRVVGPVFEHSPWIAERTPGPFHDVADLHARLVATVEAATDDEKLSLIRAHPDLVGRLAREGKLTKESNDEQAAAGLAMLTGDETTLFETYNAAYREKFGFPFVICARENKKDAILAAFPPRLASDAPKETATALQEIYKIARLRLNDLIES
ncbi:MAG TPA: 2-oxo-4-hydroxy-4-carboxy-5-ureidoimidazoline decarboxylase [Tepidisphaeraceae bacterium]|jgi:OHCU decarboxylase